jgi:hypothetical protein
MNKRGEKPLSLMEDGTKKADDRPKDLLADADISRFDSARRKKKKKRTGNREDQPQQAEGKAPSREERNGRSEGRGSRNNRRQHNRQDNNVPQNAAKNEAPKAEKTD